MEMKLLLKLLMKLGLNNYLARQLNQPSGVFGSRFIGRMMNRGNADLEALSLRSAAVTPTDHILEIGFGNGKLLQDLCKQTTTGRIYGADISEDLNEQVSKRLNAFIKNNKLELHLAGVSQLPLPNDTIDTIITNNTIYFWPSPLDDMKELLRVLKPSGKLVIGYRAADDMADYSFVQQNPDIFKNQYSDKEVRELATAAGFQSVSVRVESSGLANSHVAVCLK